MNTEASDNDFHEGQNDSERTAIRAELSSLSFEELQKLKERIGAKVYKEALFGKKDKADERKPKVFKRENKNRPREISSKKPVPMTLDVPTIKKTEIRDPRFDPLCGEFDKKQFAQNYSFLSEHRAKDIKILKAEIRDTDDPEHKKKLSKLLQRLKDKYLADKKKKMELKSAAIEKKQIEEEFKEGKRPRLRNKSERRVEDLVKQYEELKKEGTGRIQRHLKRRQQKIKKRSHTVPTGISLLKKSIA